MQIRTLPHRRCSLATVEDFSDAEAFRRSLITGTTGSGFAEARSRVFLSRGKLERLCRRIRLFWFPGNSNAPLRIRSPEVCAWKNHFNACPLLSLGIVVSKNVGGSEVSCEALHEARRDRIGCQKATTLWWYCHASNGSGRLCMEQALGHAYNNEHRVTDVPGSVCIGRVLAGIDTCPEPRRCPYRCSGYFGPASAVRS